MRLGDFYKRIKKLEEHGYSFTDKEITAIFMIANRNEIDDKLSEIEDELKLRKGIGLRYS